VFGEFITLMEPDKRLRLDGTPSKSTIALNLPYINENEKVHVHFEGEKYEISNPYTIPNQLFTLASMNSVDKSVAPLDAALRRRFHVINLEPDMDQLKTEFSKYRSEESEIEDVKTLAVKMLVYLNNQIAFFRGKDFLLGQWYLASLCKNISDIKAAQSILADIFYHKILPQLEELFHGRTEQLMKIFNLTDGRITASNPVIVVHPDADLEQYGASPYIEIKRVADSDICLFIDFISKSE
jgi:5-methylcytosine-specific restriction protein B